MKTVGRCLGLFMALVMIIGVLPVGVFSGAEPAEEGGGSGASAQWGFTVFAYAGSVTVESGVYIDGQAEKGSVLSISLDETVFPGRTFDCWKSSSGTKVPQKTFRLLVDQDVWFYPVFTDLTGSFGDWSLLVAGDCEEGSVYMREDPVTGLREYKKEYVNWGSHDFSNYEYVDEDTCACVCVICGKREEQEHSFSDETVITEATHEHGGLVRRTCYNCNTTFDVTLPMTAEHVWSADAYGGTWEIVTEAKNGQPGIRRRHCLYCEAYEDYWYVRAEWEKYYFGNKVWYDSTDSIGLWGTDDELHYNFINDEGYETYVYAVRPDYRDNYQSYVFMWIDHADALGRKALYLAKSKGYDDNGYYAYRAFDWAIVGYLDSKEAFISEIDHITCGYDRYSSGFFDLVVKYEDFYNRSMIPADEDPSFTAHNPEWIYETADGQYALLKDGETGIDFIPYKYNDARYFMHVDPATNVCISFWEPNASSYHASIRALQAIVRPDEYARLQNAFTPEQPVFPTINYPEVTETGEGHEHVYNLWSDDWQPYDNENHITFCSECGAPVYHGHSYSDTIDIDLDDPTASTRRRLCSCGYFCDHRLNVMSTDDIAGEIQSTFKRISAITSITVDVSHTPAPKNFQMRVNPYYYVDGPYAEPGAQPPYDNRFRWYGSTAPWEYGYEVTDWFSFGIVRTENTPAGYANYNGGDSFYVKLPYEELDNYAFDGWEIYDWASGGWVFFSAEPQPEFNKVAWEGDYHDPSVSFTSDTRIGDMTLLRCRRVYTGTEIPAAPASVTVVGGICYDEGNWSSASATGTFAAGTMVYFERDNSQVPEGKRFEGWRIEKDGVVTDECSYAWGVTLESGNYVFTAVYVTAQYYIQAEGENGYVYLDEVNGEPPADFGKGKTDETSEQEPFWGGEFDVGSVLTMHTEGEEGYPYFYGWYFKSWGKEDGMGDEDELLGTDTTLTYTIRGEAEGRIVAKWGESEEPPVTWHDLTVVNGFASVNNMREGIRVSSIRVSNETYVTVCPDPTNRLDVEVWTMTGEDYESQSTPRSAGVADFSISEEMPYLLTVTPTGSAHVHDLEWNEALAPTCTEYGHIAYFCCEGCDSYFTDENAENETTYEDVLLDPLGHDFGAWTYEDESGHKRVCSRCGEEETERHGSSDWIDCGAEGHCMRCPACEADYVMLMHRYSSEVTVRPTAHSKGEMTYTCTLCGHSYTEELPETSGELDYAYMPELFYTYDGQPVIYDLHEITAYDEYGEVTPDYAGFTVFIEQNGVQTQTTVDPDTFEALGPTEVGEYYIVVKISDGEGGYVEIARIYCSVMPADNLPEDVDGDGDVDIADVTTLISVLSSGGTAALVGDLNGNQTTDIGDVTVLLNYLANN